MFPWRRRRDQDDPPAEPEVPATSAVSPDAAPAEAPALPEQHSSSAPDEPEEEDEPAAPRVGFFGRIKTLFGARTEIGEAFYEELEELLIQADVGVVTAQRLLEALRERVEQDRLKTAEEAREAFEDELAGFLDDERTDLDLNRQLTLILVVGVNGVGKTTTIGKLAKMLSSQGKQLVLAAGDTFRAAATEQLELWGERANVPVIAHQAGSDPSAVIFDALAAAEARGADVVIADTAGRLHTKFNLMEELKKISRVASKQLPGAPHEVLLILDATTGQNALLQAKEFAQVAAVTGLIVTKLDSSAKGGMIFAIRDELGLPVKFIGTGEQIGDLAPFDPDAFVAGLFA